MNGPLRIDTMFAFIVVDDDGTEGIPAIPDGNTMLLLPLVGADIKRVEQIKEMVKQIQTVDPLLVGKTVTLVQFSQRTELAVFEDGQDAAMEGTPVICQCGHDESVHETVEYRVTDKPRRCFFAECECRRFSESAVLGHGFHPELPPNKEQIYDEAIAPLMKQILAICGANNIAMIASFALPIPGNPALQCTSSLLTPKYTNDMPDVMKNNYLAAHSIMYQGFIAYTTRLKK